MRNLRCLTSLLICWAMLALPTPSRVGTEVKEDEDVVLFPALASFDAKQDRWLVPVHGWIFEPEADSHLRRGALAGLRRAVGLPADSASGRVFVARARHFLVDNERGKKLTVHFGQDAFVLPASEKSGHFRGQVLLTRQQVVALQGSSSAAGGWLPFEIRGRGERRFAGRFLPLGPVGTSLISDLDDTVKISQVADRKELLANTFQREFRAVPGMAEAYSRWVRDGAAVHYVSASPWQLYAPLSQFLTQAGFPAGEFRLKTFRLKDGSFFDLFASPEETKRQALLPILAAFPRRQFVLVGDSGEKDPEIYGRLAREQPERIIATFIRNVTDEKADSPRLKAAFAGVPRQRWRLFKDGSGLPQRLPRAD